MTKQFLNRADVVTGLEEVRRDEWRNVCGVAGFAMYELRSASHATTPARGDRVGSCWGGKNMSKAHENIRLAPGRFCHVRPARPRPLFCKSAPNNHGLASRGAPLRALSNRSALVESVCSSQSI